MDQIPFRHRLRRTYNGVIAVQTLMIEDIEVAPAVEGRVNVSHSDDWSDDLRVAKNLQNPIAQFHFNSSTLPRSA